MPEEELGPALIEVRHGEPRAVRRPYALDAMGECGDSPSPVGTAYTGAHSILNFKRCLILIHFGVLPPEHLRQSVGLSYNSSGGEKPPDLRRCLFLLDLCLLAQTLRHEKGGERQK